MSDTSPTDLMDEMLAPTEAAALIKSTASTLADWRFKGKGPRFYRLGKRVFYRRADLVAWAASQVVDPAEERRVA